MKRKGFRLICVLAALLILVSAFAACGSNTSATSATTTTTQGAATVTEPAASTAAEELKPVTLRFYFPGDAKSAANEVWSEISTKFVKELNSKFEINWISFNDFSDKMSVMAASGDDWDLNFDGNWLNYSKMINKGAYLELNDLLPKYAPNAYAALTKAGSLAAATVKGKIMCVPWEMKMNQDAYFFKYRTDLADKYGIKVESVATIEDMEKILIDAKAKLPKDISVIGWDNTTTGSIPFGLLRNRDELRSLDFHDLVYDLNDPTCKIKAIEQTQGFRDAAKIVKRWYDTGLVAKNLMVDKEQYSAKERNGKTFAAVTSHEIATMVTQFSDPSFKTAGLAIYPDKKTANRSALANTVCLNKNAANPERTLMFLDLLSTNKEMYDLVIYGIKGVTYNLDGETAVYPEGMNGSNSTYQDWQGVWGFWKPQFMRPNTQYPAGFWQKEAEFASAAPHMSDLLDGFFASTDNIKNEVAKRDTVNGEDGKLIGYGVVPDSDKAVDNYIQKQKDAGLDKILADIQSQVDAFLASKK